MFKKTWHVITVILGLLLTICMIYIIGLLFNIIPREYMPAQVFPEQYNSFITYLSKDAESKSATAKLSESLYEYINGQDTTKKTETEDDKTNNPDSPITKAKAAVDNYNQSLQNEKQDLDKY